MPTVLWLWIWTIPCLFSFDQYKNLKEVILELSKQEWSKQWLRQSLKSQDGDHLSFLQQILKFCSNFICKVTVILGENEQ
jgi:hypothetical protein